MSAWKKDPTDVMDFWFDWGSDAQAVGDRFLTADESIINAFVTVPVGLGNEDSDFTDKVVRVRLSGGEVGDKFDIDCDIVTSDGQTFSMTKKLQIKERIYS